MLIIELIRYFFGYINFRASGGFADRFLNLCTKDGIPLWNIKNVNGNISASTTIDGYLSIRRPAKKSGMRVVHTEKKGLIFLLKKYKRRIGLVVGVLLSSIIIFTLTQFVWSVSVVGNVSIDDDYLLSQFETYGIKVGVKISDLDLENAEITALRDNEKLSWAKINKKGTVLVIEVREKTDAPEMYDNSKPTNLVASDDGLILSIDVLYGNEEVKPGSAVVKGDLLVSGIISHADGTQTAIHADGYVKALVKKQKECRSSSFSIFNIEEDKKRESIFFFGIKIPLGTAVPQNYFTSHKSFVRNEEMLLPLGIITEYGCKFSKEQMILNHETQKKISLFNSALFTKELLESCEIKKSCVEEKIENDEIKFIFYAECEQEIGVLQEIYVEKTNDIA